MTPGARLQAAIEILDAIDEGRASADDVVRSYFRPRRYAGSKDRRAVRERVFGVLRSRARLDWWLASASGCLEPENRARVLADVVLTDRDDPALLFGSGGHAPTEQTEEEKELTAALSDKAIDHPAQAPVARCELPHWLNDAFHAAWGDDFETEGQALTAADAAVDLRVASSRVSRDQARKALIKAGIASEATPLSPAGLRLTERADISKAKPFVTGLVEVQDEGSQLLSFLADAKPGMAVCDYCAGAGGKTLAMAETMGLRDGEAAGRLVACDTEAKRLARMDDRLKRALLTDRIERQTLTDDGWAAENEATFDRVLIDVPCSGSGAWRRHPEAKWQLTPARLADLTALQDKILRKAAPLVRPGGRLVYATCSVLPVENNDRISAFLADNSDFALLAVSDIWQQLSLPASPCVGETLQLSPARSGTDGFFLSVLQRKSA